MRSLVDKDRTKNEDASLQQQTYCSSGGDDFEQFGIKALELKDNEYKKKIFDELLGYPVDS